MLKPIQCCSINYSYYLQLKKYRCQDTVWKCVLNLISWKFFAYFSSKKKNCCKTIFLQKGVGLGFKTICITHVTYIRVSVATKEPLFEFIDVCYLPLLSKLSAKILDGKTVHCLFYLGRLFGRNLETCMSMEGIL